ncbi:hypothetical protein CRUP_019705 [Coryphaenoides rupestris]|nr:hypothetical protein CRUP_019705 [Coryphaenoides rupestris]
MEERVCASDSSNAVNKARDAAAAPYRDYIHVILKRLAEFARELNLGDAVLKVDVNVDALTSLPPKWGVANGLRKHIAELQSVSESLKSLVAAERHSKMEPLSSRPASVVPSPHKEETGSARLVCPPRCHGGPDDDDEDDDDEEEGGSESRVDDLTVQIKAGKSEIDRRIFAFMERKQMEINENNVREFCNKTAVPEQMQYLPRTRDLKATHPGGEHLRAPDPGAAGGHGDAGDPQKGPPVRECGNPAIEERLQNMEAHLKLPAAGPVPLSVYRRLQKLENRVLELEGLSPEYFQSAAFLHKRAKMSSAQSGTELDGKNQRREGCSAEEGSTEFGAALRHPTCPPTYNP